MPDVLNIPLSDRLRVRNLNHELPEDHPLHGQPVTLEWNSRRFTILPGQEDVVPFEVVQTYFGDPRATDITVSVREHPNAMPEWIPDRQTECRRLYQYYLPSEFGTNRVSFREFVPGDRSSFANGISDRAPNVEVYTVSGDRVYTVLDDPYGDRVIAAVPTRSDREALDHQMRSLQQVNAAQQEMMERLQAEIAQLRAGLTAGPSDIPGVPVDAAADRPEHPIFGTPQASTVGGEEVPEMVYDPKSRRVSRKKPQQDDPTRLEDLPVDRG